MFTPSFANDASNTLKREARFAEQNGWLAGYCITPTNGFEPGPVSGDAIARRRAADASATRKPPYVHTGFECGAL